MKFQNKLAYLIKNQTRNNTNTKNYTSLKNDYIFEVKFTYSPSNQEIKESCIVGRTGYMFGIYVVESNDWLKPTEDIFNKLNNTIKFTWFRHENNEIVYDDIMFGLKPENPEIHMDWWKRYIEKNTPKPLDDDLLNGLTRRWSLFSNEYKINSNNINDTDILEWIRKIDEEKNKTGSHITGDTKVKIVKKDNEFHLYVNDIFYASKPTGDIIDYSDSTICIGVDDPYKEGDNLLWYNGEIHDVKIYETSIEKPEYLYCWLDFERHTQFKVFDISLNGNHAEIYETEEHRNKINTEFNKLSRPAKIV